MKCVANFILKISISRQNHAIHICIHASLAATGEYFCAVGLRSTQLQCYLDTRSLNVFNDNSINITLGHITITGSCSVLLGCPTECGTLQSIETSNQGKLFTISTSIFTSRVLIRRQKSRTPFCINSKPSWWLEMNSSIMCSKTYHGCMPDQNLSCSDFPQHKTA